MRLEEALPFLREGKGITRPEWNRFCFILGKNNFLLRKYLRDVENFGSSIRAGHAESTHFSNSCMLYDDWEVVDEV